LRHDIAEDSAAKTELVEIPFVYRYNLPDDAQRIFRSVYNAELQQHGSRRNDGLARQRAIAAVKELFARDDVGMWRPKEAVETARPLASRSRFNAGTVSAVSGNASTPDHAGSEVER